MGCVDFLFWSTESKEAGINRVKIGGGYRCCCLVCRALRLRGLGLLVEALGNRVPGNEGYAVLN